MSAARVPLWRYVRQTKPGSTHHQAFWNALEDALPAELIRRIGPGGDLQGIWEAQGAEAKPAEAVERR